MRKVMGAVLAAVTVGALAAPAGAATAGEVKETKDRGTFSTYTALTDCGDPNVGTLLVHLYATNGGGNKIYQDVTVEMTCDGFDAIA